MAFEVEPSAGSVPPAVLALVGCMVARLIVDDAVTLVLRSRDGEVTLRIDGRGEWMASGVSRSFDPDADPASVACFLPLLHRVVGGVELSQDGGLALAFGPDRLSVCAHEHQISWSVQSSNGASASCLAEGMVVWQ